MTIVFINIQMHFCSHCPLLGVIFLHFLTWDDVIQNLAQFLSLNSIMILLYIGFLYSTTDNSVHWWSITVQLHGRYKYQRYCRDDTFESMHQFDWYRHHEAYCWNWWSYTHRMDALLSSARFKSVGNRRFRWHRMCILWNGTYKFQMHSIRTRCAPILTLLKFIVADKNPIQIEWQLSNNID